MVAVSAAWLIVKVGLFARRSHARRVGTLEPLGGCSVPPVIACAQPATVSPAMRASYVMFVVPLLLSVMVVLVPFQFVTVVLTTPESAGVIAVTVGSLVP